MAVEESALYNFTRFECRHFFPTLEHFHVLVAASQMRDLPFSRLRPGLAADVIIYVRSKTPIIYVMRSILKLELLRGPVAALVPDSLLREELLPHLKPALLLRSWKLSGLFESPGEDLFKSGT